MMNIVDFNSKNSLFLDFYFKVNKLIKKEKCTYDNDPHGFGQQERCVVLLEERKEDVVRLLPGMFIWVRLNPRTAATLQPVSLKRKCII